MAIMTEVVTVVANTTSVNLCAGKSAEFIKEPSIVALSCTGSAVGLFATFIVGEEVVIDDQPIPLTNRFPVVPDDTMARGGGLPGDRVNVRLRNSTGGNLTGWMRVDIEPA
jgi:hypothetical protein